MASLVLATYNFNESTFTQSFYTGWGACYKLASVNRSLLLYQIAPPDERYRLTLYARAKTSQYDGLMTFQTIGLLKVSPSGWTNIQLALIGSKNISIRTLSVRREENIVSWSSMTTTAI